MLEDLTLFALDELDAGVVGRERRLSVRRPPLKKRLSSVIEDWDLELSEVLDEL